MLTAPTVELNSDGVAMAEDDASQSSEGGRVGHTLDVRTCTGGYDICRYEGDVFETRDQGREPRF